MPTGSFFGDTGLTPDSRAGGSITGPGPASQPRGPSLSDTWGAPVSPGYQGGQGSTAPGFSSLNPNIGKWAINAASSQLAQQAIGPQPATDLSGARSILDTFYGPSTALAQNQLARQLSGLGTVPVNADYNAGLLNRDTDLARAGIALDKKGVGLDRERLGVDTSLTSGQLANLDRLRGILAKQYGLEGENFDVQLANLGIDEAKLKDMASRQIFDLRSNLTARGAFNTVANERGTGRINTDLNFGLDQLSNQRKLTDIAHRGNVLGLDEKGIGYDNQGLSLRARLANNGIDSRQLDLTLERLGLSEQQVENNLRDGLANIGFESEAQINGFLDSIQGLLVGVSADQYTQILNDLSGLMNLPPEVIAGLIGAPTQAPTTAPSGSADPTRNL